MNSSTTAVVEALDVEKTYDDGPAPIPVLRRLSLAVQAGDTISIRGPSGSGKSTLLHLLGALDRPTRGSVRVRGRDLAGMTDDELAGVRNRDIGFVFQSHHLLPQFTVLENVLVPALASGRVEAVQVDRATRLLAAVGLESRSGHRPAHLSGGERQRVAVVRALIHRPAVLLADEPTGSLDRAGAAALVDLLVHLNRVEGTALVVVTHSPEVAARAARRYELCDGDLRDAQG
jgi:predicted ABC-type transport system involved in lysophospholipase L1 biosynthesis ATPase subunit